jgi:hypothetical protein
METQGWRLITSEESWMISCHEAGHAVIAVRRRILFEYVQRGKGEHGLVKSCGGPIENPDRPWPQDEIARWQQFYAAGAAAELLLFGTYREYGSRRDRALHEKLEKRRYPSRVNAWKVEIQFASQILDRESVERVAKELERRKKLKYEHVHYLLGCKPLC